MAQVWKSTGVKVARMVGDSQAMDSVAAEVEAAAKSEAAKHRDTGNYAASITTKTVPGKNGVKDRVVVAEDPAAMSIEFGHLSGRKGSDSRRWIPGKFIMINAASRVK